MFCLQVSEEEVARLVSTSLGSTPTLSLDFSKFHFCPRIIPDRDSVGAMFLMFSELGMVSRWRIARDSLARFILLVRRGYRSPPYHNWCHGFTVAHFAYLVLRRSRLLEAGVVTRLDSTQL